MIAYGLSFFHNQTYLWNLFDIAVVTAQSADFILGSSTNLMGIRCLRILRLVRILKVIRFVPMLGQLRVMIFCLMNIVSMREKLTVVSSVRSEFSRSEFSP